MALIERESLLAAYDAAHKGPPGGARRLIENAPEVDAVPVVRCRECRYWFGPDDGKEHSCELDALCRPADWYCAGGERRDEYLVPPTWIDWLHSMGLILKPIGWDCDTHDIPLACITTEAAKRHIPPHVWQAIEKLVTVQDDEGIPSGVWPRVTGAMYIDKGESTRKAASRKLWLQPKDD